MGKPDVTIQGEGTIYLATPESEAARAWMREHVQEDATYYGDALVVEHRYAEPLVVGMILDGLRVAASGGWLALDEKGASVVFTGELVQAGEAP